MKSKLLYIFATIIIAAECVFAQPKAIPVAPTLPPAVLELAPQLMTEQIPPSFLSYSTRPWPGSKDEELELKLCMETGTEQHGLLAFDALSGIPAWNAQRKIIAFEVAGEVDILDLNSEKITQINDAMRVTRQNPNFDSSGRQLVMAGSYSPVDTSTNKNLDQDIFLYAASGETNWRIKSACALAGEDSLPTFSPDGKYVYFVNKSDIGSRLYRAAVDANTLGTPEKMADLTADNIDRLSWLNNGKSLALSPENVGENLKSLRYFVFDTQTKKVTARTQAFTTSSYPGISISKLRQIGFSPNGQLTYFNAVITHPQDKRGSTRNAYFDMKYKTMRLLGNNDVTAMRTYEYKKANAIGVNAFRKLRASK